MIDKQKSQSKLLKINKRDRVNCTNCNLYHYAGNNPVKYTDPDGNDICATATNPSFWSGIGIILATLAEDIATWGAGIADDPATLAIGATLVMTAYECSKSNDRSVPYVNAETKVTYHR